jgi:hypothetical protein
VRRSGARRTVAKVVREEVTGAYATPDGRWRVEVVRRGRTEWFRILTGDGNVLESLASIATVERILGADHPKLQAVPVDAPWPPETNDESSTSGAA